MTKSSDGFLVRLTPAGILWAVFALLTACSAGAVLASPSDSLLASVVAATLILLLAALALVGALAMMSHPTNRGAVDAGEGTPSTPVQ